jgi:hypothetical protein
MTFRRLNDQGMEKLREWFDGIRGGQTLTAPLHLLSDPETSTALTFRFDPSVLVFTNRAELGGQLAPALRSHRKEVLYDEGFWSALALFWIDLICPDEGGVRKPGEVARYVHDARRKSYRHLIWAAWWAIDRYGEDGAYLLLPASASANQMTFGGGEVMGQIAANQMTTAAPSVIKLGRRLYASRSTSRQLSGSSGKGAASPRRFIQVLRHFELTYDFSSMTAENLAKLLPPEFKKRLSAA